ncbi:putative Thaumatin family [Helianthus annuus]|nr:putative Thaumatin family [Helianthus annuus]KAJ0466777.1 putative Thaumatin family [Helianthus annuus]KAJ0484345.1 putative Thaumatin family [Helianthus annuus]KAJ0654898.1 putative Thaumatin family [Helianthus annuus]KAJ0658629.1 putative Thaumatin family [Helianthus annuus]
MCLLIKRFLTFAGVFSSATTFTIVNKCDQTVWPGVLSNPGVIPLQPTGFTLQKGESKVLHAPRSWAGRFWGRTHCYEDSGGKFTCGTGDCGSGKLECAGASASPPATLAKFTLGGTDFFVVSLVGGYNLPVLVVPIGGSGDNCTSTGCTVDLNDRCPSALKVVNSDREAVACKSACVAFGRQEDCCRGAYGTRGTCKPSSYSQVFKTACPRASSYAYDDQTSTFSCTGADYQITFCPTSTTSKKPKQEQQTPNKPHFNTGTVYEDANTTGHSSAPPRSSFIRALIGAVVGVGVLLFGAGCAYTIRTGNVNIMNGSCNCFRK